MHRLNIITGNLILTLIISLKQQIQKFQYHLKKFTDKSKNSEPDFLTNEHITFCGDNIVEELCILFNSILRHTHVSQMFKVGKVISLFKGKKKIEVILSTIEVLPTFALSKLFEKIN